MYKFSQFDVNTEFRDKIYSLSKKYYFMPFPYNEMLLGMRNAYHKTVGDFKKDCQVSNITFYKDEPRIIISVYCVAKKKDYCKIVIWRNTMDTKWVHGIKFANKKYMPLEMLNE